MERETVEVIDTGSIDGEFVAASAIEVVRFEIETCKRDRESGHAELPWRQQLTSLAHTLASLDTPNAIWHAGGRRCP